MFVSMNRFKIRTGREADFEAAWRGRETFLDEVPGYLAFAVLRNETAADGVTEFISTATWQSREDFEAWRNSDLFRRAHAQGSLEGVLAGPPEVSLYEAVVSEERTRVEAP